MGYIYIHVESCTRNLCDVARSRNGWNWVIFHRIEWEIEWDIVGSKGLELHDVAAAAQRDLMGVFVGSHGIFCRINSDEWDIV